MLDEGPQFRLLYDLGCAFAARLELDELIPLVVGKCREVLDAEGAAVLLLDAGRSELSFPYVAEEDPEVAGSLADLRLPADQGIGGAVLRSGEPAPIDDASVDPRFYADIDASSSLPGEASAVPGCAQPRRREERGPDGGAPPRRPRTCYAGLAASPWRCKGRQAPLPPLVRCGTRRAQPRVIDGW